MVEDRRRPAVESSTDSEVHPMSNELLESMPRLILPEIQRSVVRRTRTGTLQMTTVGSILGQDGIITENGSSGGQQEKATEMNGGAVTHLRNRRGRSSSLPCDSREGVLCPA